MSGRLFYRSTYEINLIIYNDTATKSTIKSNGNIESQFFFFSFLFMSKLSRNSEKQSINYLWSGVCGLLSRFAESPDRTRSHRSAVWIPIKLYYWRTFERDSSTQRVRKFLHFTFHRRYICEKCSILFPRDTASSENTTPNRKAHQRFSILSTI